MRLPIGSPTIEIRDVRLTMAAAHPAMIGTHWFQWIDQPSTGRNDGENYNIGYLDVCDRPYTELINATKETFKRLPDIHSGKEPPVSRKAITQ